MKGGDGAYSYTKNSQLQKEWSDSVKEMIQDAVIEKLDVEMVNNTVSIVDFGCSVGPNTFFTVHNLIQPLLTKFSRTKNEVEFQVFFNDESGNDFNTLLASLPPERQCQYHAAGVPGSNKGCLMRAESTTRVHPIEDVAQAYSDQFERDLQVFVSARADEFVRGLMFLVLPGIPDGDGGEVVKSAVDAFNLPIYFPKAVEMRKVIEKNGCFSIERMELIDSRSQVEEGVNVANLLVHFRAGMEGILTAHFGSRVVDKTFDAISAKAEEISRCLEGPNYKSSQLFVVLKRK